MKSHSGTLFDRIETSRNLPTIPHILLKLIEVCNSPDSTIDEISHIINKDSSLCTKVMRMVNSAYYGLPTRLTGIGQALVLLGTDAIKNIAVSASVFQVFGAAKGDSAFNLKVFWRHCLLCATLAKLIAKQTSYNPADEAFLSGLLHDIGKLVLWVNFSKKYGEVLQSSHRKSDLLLAAEKRMGATHCEVGAWMISRWNLESFMADAVLYHHEHVHKILDALPLVKIVFVANVLSTDTIEQDTRFETAREVFGFSRSQSQGLIMEAEQEVEHVAQSLGIEIETLELPDVTAPDTDSEKERDLVSGVRDFSLLQGTLQNLLHAHGQEPLLNVVKQGLQVLLDVNSVLFLLHDPEKDALVGRGALDPRRDSLAKEVVIPLQTKNCLPIKCLEQAAPLDSFGCLSREDLSIIDNQIIRLIGTDAILCLPMVAHNNSVGVIILGVEQARISHLCKQTALLTMFANQSALALHADNVKQAQLKLVQSERLAASSAVAKRIVHEVNNPLSIIKNYIKILGLKLSAGDPARDDLRIINEELDRVALIVGELSDFSQPEVRQLEPVDVNALLSDLVKITWESLMLDSRINFRLDLESSLPIIFSEKNSLKQVFINLVSNAAEAMPPGGNIHISTRHISNRLGEQLNHTMKKDPGQVEITIRDEGPGISDSIKSRLFEPFVTTKTDGHAGLGLSIAYNIVKELKGNITCESSEKTGTRFKIVLPVAT